MKNSNITSKIWFKVILLILIIMVIWSGYLVTPLLFNPSPAELEEAIVKQKNDSSSGIVAMPGDIDLGKTTGGVLVREGINIGDNVIFNIPEIGVSIKMPYPYKYLLIREISNMESSKKGYHIGFVSKVDRQNIAGDNTEGVLSILAIPRGFYWPRGGYIGDLTSFTYGDDGKFTAHSWFNDPRDTSSGRDESFVAKNYRKTDKLSSAIFDIGQYYGSKVIEDSTHFAIVDLYAGDYPGFSILYSELQKSKEVPGFEITESIFREIVEGIEGL